MNGTSCAWADSILSDLPAAVERFWDTCRADGPGEAAVRREHWNRVVELDEQVRRELHGRVDLSRVDEETEARLYACLVLQYFTPRPLSQPGVVLSPPLYSPQQAGLRVFFERGSWYATWTRLEEALFQPVEQRWTWLRIEEAGPGLLRFLDATTPPILQRESE